MRNFGGLLFLAGAVGFFYCSSQLAGMGPAPTGVSLSETIQHPAGRLEVLRMVSAAGGVVGLLLAMFPKGR